MNWDLEDIYQSDALAAAGVVIGGHDVPYPPMPAPQYRSCRNGAWTFSSGWLAACPGYFSGPQFVPWEAHFLSRDDMVWMSVVPSEVESQMPHCAHAAGTVVVCGLGLGLMAYAVSARRAVDRVIVVERDPEVIAMFRDFARFDDWPQRRKVDLVQSDARAFRFDGADFLYADIWPKYRMDAMVADMQAMHANIPAPACGYWGQELDMVDWAAGRGVPLEDFSAEHVRAFAEAVGLPLIGLAEPTYAQLCGQAARNPSLNGLRIPLS